mgnify:CR=1 FL=1
MDTCRQLANKSKRIHDGRGGILRISEACGNALTDGLCPFHDGPLPEPAPQPEPAPITVEAHNDVLAWAEQERARCGGWEAARMEGLFYSGEIREGR